MNPAGTIIVLLAAAYLVGSVQFGLLVSRLKGVDIRMCGSGNVGATNVGRVLGPKWGLLVFVLDVGKGAASTLGALAVTRAGLFGVSLSPNLFDLLALGVAASCVAGSIAPFYLGFRGGGKGVATSLGAILGIYPTLTYPALVALAVWAVVVRVTGYVSLGSIIAACSVPVGFVALLVPTGARLDEHYPLFVLSVLLAVVVVVRHRSNIARLLAGTENRIWPKSETRGRAERGDGC